MCLNNYGDIKMVPELKHKIIIANPVLTKYIADYCDANSVAEMIKFLRDSSDEIEQILNLQECAELYDSSDEEECEEINKYCNSVLKSCNNRLLAISYTEDCFAEYVKAIHTKYFNKENALISVMKYFVDDENTTQALLKLIELLPSKSDAEVTSALYEYASSNPKRIIAAKEVAAISFLHDYLLGVNF